MNIEKSDNVVNEIMNEIIKPETKQIMKTYQEFLIEQLKLNDINISDFQLNNELFQEKHNISKQEFIQKVRENYKNWYSSDYQLMINNYNNKIQKNKKIYDEQKKQTLIGIVMRQTELTEEKAKEYLEIEEFDYEKVIKNYLSDSNYYKQTTVDNSPKTTNQKIHTELRNFMETLNVQ